MPIHKAQTISYLKLTNADLAIIANFGANSLQDQRLPNFIRDKTAEFQWKPPALGTDILYPTLTENILKAFSGSHAPAWEPSLDAPASRVCWGASHAPFNFQAVRRTHPTLATYFFQSLK